jgi:hypothetical protein
LRGPFYVILRVLGHQAEEDADLVCFRRGHPQSSLALGRRGTASAAPRPIRLKPSISYSALDQADANDVVGAVHPKAMPVILTTPAEIEQWMSAPVDEALQLDRMAH